MLIDEYNLEITQKVVYRVGNWAVFLLVIAAGSFVLRYTVGL